VFDSSLHYPDRPEWKRESDYQDVVAALLTEIFDDLNHPNHIDEPYQHALARAEYCLTLSMSLRQRMLVKWAQSMGYIGLMEWRQGSDCLDDALELAEQLGDVPSCAEIAFFNGSACSADLNYESARDYNSHALSLLQELSGSEQSIHPDFEARILLNLASSDFTLEMYEDAQAHIAQAHILIELPLTHAPQDALRSRQLANLYWIEAILQRWIGIPEMALHLALKAYDLYSQASSPTLLSQLATISSVTAETALDLAETISSNPVSDARIAYLEVARPYVEAALKAAHAAQDDLAAGLALLTDIRYRIVRSEPVDFESLTTAVLKTADDRHNPAVAIQAYTTLGRAFATRKQRTVAADCFRQATTIADASRLPSMSMWARRALIWESELS
jgi:tetratricopeptide (TPR) repeat protein